MKHFPSPTTVAGPAAHALAAALLAAVFTALLFLYVPRGAFAQEDSPATTPEGGAASANDGEVFASGGCARAGDVVAGDCSEGKGGRDESGGADAAGGPSNDRYGVEDGSGSGEATVLESTTFGDGGSGERGEESTQSQTIESTTGVVEDKSGGDADAEMHSGTAGGELRPGAADEGCAVDGPAETMTTTVERVADGDTVETPEGTVRLIGADTPETLDPGEPPEPGGEEASEFTAASLEGEEVELEIGTEPEDDYDRTLAYLWTDGTMFNETLLREGMGELLIIPPNDEYERCLAAAQQSAQQEGTGIWAEDESVPPETMAETTAPETTGADTTPPAEDEEGQEGLLEGIFGGDEPSDASAVDQYAGETTDPETTVGPSPAEGQYEEEGASEPELRADEPEVQEEIQEPEVQDPPAPSNELANSTPSPLSAEGSAEPSADAAQYHISSAPASPAGAASRATLPETGGASVLRLALLPMGALLAYSGLVAAGLARRDRGAHRGPALRERAGR